jgi:uncharacterized membrane protein (DUF485 family)
MEQTGRNTRTGMVFFILYFLVYSSFVLLSAFAPSLLERQIAGINLAVLSGVGLIMGAIVLAIFYCWICRDLPAGRQEPRS